MAESSVHDIIRQVRRRLIESRTAGLCQWFDLFDQHVHQGKLEVCAALLEEVADQKYPLSEDEAVYVSSRKGVYHLAKGLELFREGSADEANGHLQTSLGLQRAVGCRSCEGEVLEALGLLKDGQLPASSALLHRRFQVAGGSESLLSRRLEQLEQPGRRGDSIVNESSRRETVRVVAQLGVVKPLLEGLRSPDPTTRSLMMAVAARLQPIRNQDALLARLRDDSLWFVRWRAAQAIDSRGPAAGGTPKPQDSAPPPPPVAALADALRSEQDPEVLVALARLAGAAGDRTVSPPLCKALDDPDPDVRCAAAEALGKVGTRQCLSSLNAVHDGTTLANESVRAAAKAAVTQIEARYPRVITEVQTARLLPGRILHRSLVFLRTDPVMYVARLSRVPDEVEVQVLCREAADHREEKAPLFVEAKLLRDYRGETAAAPFSVLRESSRTAVPSPKSDGQRDLPERDARFVVGTVVECSVDGASGCGRLRRGHRGTVRAILTDRLGVEWEPEVGGHAGNQAFACAPGHGWSVRTDEVEAVADGLGPNAVVVTLPPPHPSGWQAGNYVISLRFKYDPGEGFLDATPITFRVISQIEVEAAVICLEADLADRPWCASEIIASGSRFACCWHLSLAPPDLEGKALVHGPDGRLVAEGKVKTHSNGRQYVAARFAPAERETGKYRMQLVLLGEVRHTTFFRVTAQPTLRRATLCQDVTARGEPVVPVEIFPNSAPAIHCSVLVGDCSPLSHVAAEWFCLAEPNWFIVDCVAKTWLGSVQHLVFTLSKPSRGWRPGQYEIRLAGLTHQEAALCLAGRTNNLNTQTIDETRWLRLRFTIAQ